MFYCRRFFIAPDNKQGYSYGMTSPVLLARAEAFFRDIESADRLTATTLLAALLEAERDDERRRCEREHGEKALAFAERMAMAGWVAP